MAEGLLKSFDPRIEVHSAGTKPAEQVNPHATRVMKEIGLDISGSYPKTVDGFLNEEIDYIITVCGDADENCPVSKAASGGGWTSGFLIRPKLRAPRRKSLAFSGSRETKSKPSSRNSTSRS